tara:strand:+ start:677 stop:991 length:315 start_codon:yes stop_codon:yes gene_type:complete
MKTDTYTKIVLTVIAVCLFVSTFTPYDFIDKAHADEIDHITEILNKPTEVKIVSVDPSVIIGVNVRKIIGLTPAVLIHSYTKSNKPTYAPIIFNEEINKDLFND